MDDSESGFSDSQNTPDVHIAPANPCESSSSSDNSSSSSESGSSSSSDGSSSSSSSDESSPSENSRDVPIQPINLICSTDPIDPNQSISSDIVQSNLTDSYTDNFERVIPVALEPPNEESSNAHFAPDEDNSVPMDMDDEDCVEVVPLEQQDNNGTTQVPADSDTNESFNWSAAVNNRLPVSQEELSAVSMPTTEITNDSSINLDIGNDSKQSKSEADKELLYENTSTQESALDLVNENIQTTSTNEQDEAEQEVTEQATAEIESDVIEADQSDHQIQKEEQDEEEEEELEEEEEPEEEDSNDDVENFDFQMPTGKMSKNQKRKWRKKRRNMERKLQEKIAKRQRKSVKTTKKTKNSALTEKVEIEYVPESIEQADEVYHQFSKVFEKFKSVESERIVDDEERTKDDASDKLFERKKPVEFELKDDDEDGLDSKISKRKLKQLSRMTVAELKQKVAHPELVEMHDVTAKDPIILLHLKGCRNSVPVPRHWCYKRKYLQGKRGFEKPPFKLPDFIKRTGIMEMRQAVLEKEDAKTLKTKMREKIRPKMGKIDIDYQKLHDAFFRWQSKPPMNIHGDLYYEGKELETKLKEKKPGDLSTDLRLALGMPTGPQANKCPPPWLIAMQRYGPPPSYPNLKIPGLNAPIPEGCMFGYHAGGWGKPPVDDYGRPLYGDVFGVLQPQEAQEPEEPINYSLWGEMESDEEEEEEEEDEEEAEEDAQPEIEKQADESGLVTPAEGLVTPSGLTSIPAGLETPDFIELRKRKIEAEMER